MSTNDAFNISFGFDLDFIDRVQDYIEIMPDEGMRLIDFEEECLRDIPPSERAKLLNKMQNRGLVFIERVGVIQHAFKNRPRCAFPPDRNDLLDLFVAEASPYVRLLRQAIDAERRTADCTAERRVKREALRLVNFTRRRIRPGTSFEDLRRELWLTFADSVLAVAAKFDRGFRNDAPIFEAPMKRPRKSRLPNNMPTDERLIRLAEREGAIGITRVELRKAFGPSVSRARLDARIDALEADGRLLSAPMRLEETGRMTERYFTAPQGLPHVRDDGLATWGPL